MKKYFPVLIVLLGLNIFIFSQPAEKLGNLFKDLKWRSIGPANMGGRTVDIDVVESDPGIIYAAIGPSGVWKSTNSGTTWEPVFENENTVSVGDIAIAQSHPQIIWVGTGEATCRNSVTIGDGVYKSTDSGKTWTNMGLKDTRHISRIVINPGDPNIVYVAAMGHLWGPNKDRGIYKTSDGGKTWEKVLYIDEDTGFSDLAMDPSDSLILYAAAYQHRRLPYYFSSGGPQSGIYKTTDGGRTWNKLKKDLPGGNIGRIGLDVSRSSPGVVYALIEHEDGGIWRSEDKGESWIRMCDKETYDRVNNRPFYYSQIRVDPTDDKVIYVFSSGLFVSEDKGKKFRSISGGTHPDHHALWINPANPLHLIDGNDGGIDISYDGGKSWRSIKHMALAEVYQIGFDMRKPYFVYCGLQDNGVWGGPSAALDTAGIVNCDWYAVGGGDGFYCRVDPDDFNTVYANSQMNGLYRYDLRTGLSKRIRPEAPLTEPPYRYNWNSPVHISPHDSKTIYTGGNVLFKSTDRGHSWEIISPDLTTEDPDKMIDSGGPISPENTGAEIHCSIITIAESPVEKGVIWCGTDDGNVQITKDGGKTWANVTGNIPGLPPNTWCSRIEVSHFEKGTAYAAFDGHRHDDYNTYLYKTKDFGKTWTSIKGNLPFGWIHVIREDLMNPNLLFVGTEFGIFASLDGGKSWFSLKNNLPTLAVRDIAVHPREHDLIIGTHGRGIWILDNITPLREMSEEVLLKKAHVFSTRPATQYFLSTSKESYTKPVFQGQNPDFGLFIDVYLMEKPEEKPDILIKDQNGLKIFQIKLRAVQGLQRVSWNLYQIPRNEEGEEIKPPAMGYTTAPYAFPGKYTIELVVNDINISTLGEVLPDPRIDFPIEDRLSQQKIQVKVMALSRKLGLTVTEVNKIRRKLDNLSEEIKKSESLSKEDLLNSISNFEEKLKYFEDKIVPKGFALGLSRETALRGGHLSQLIMILGNYVSSYPGAPTETDIARAKELEEVVENIISEFISFSENELLELNKKLKENNLPLINQPKLDELK